MASLTDLERLSHNVPDDKTEQQKLHNAALKLARATESEADFVQRVMYTVRISPHLFVCHHESHKLIAMPWKSHGSSQ